MKLEVNKTFYVGLTAVMWLAILGLAALKVIQWEVAYGSLVGISGLVYALYTQYSTNEQLENKDAELNEIGTRLSKSEYQKLLIESRYREILLKDIKVNKIAVINPEITNIDEKKKQNKKPRKQSRKSK
jgi:hypothetical protein